MNVPLAFLLGPPGSGKSTAVEMYCKTKHVPCQLELFSEIKTQHQALSSLTNAFGRSQTLFLDAYDESAELNPTSLRRAIEQARDLGELPKLRLVSRQARIDDHTIQELSLAYYGDDASHAEAYVLQPLTGDQVGEFVTTRIEADQQSSFWMEVDRHGLNNSLIWPASLSSFVDVFNKDGVLGDSRRAAWRRSIEIQLEEKNPLRTKPGNLVARCGLAERWFMAQVLAATDVLCRRFPIALATSSGSRLAPAELYRELIGTLPDWISTETDFMGALTEVTDTRVFENHGGTATFHTATTSQFLAAEYLSEVDLDNLLGILTESREGRRIPDVAAPIAAELARFHADMFNHLCEHQPDIFTASVLLEFTPDQRFRIVDSLFQRREHRYHYLHGYENPGLIKHPGLADQLKPHLSVAADDDDLNLAIDMAEYSGLDELAQDLALIAYDVSRSMRSRSNAAHAILSFSPQHHDLLKPLLNLSKGEDPDDELYGCAMQALWPGAFSPAEAFRRLRKPRDAGSTGVYHGFLRYYDDGAAHRLREEHVLPGLKWLEAQERGRNDDRPLYEDLAPLRHSITALAWQHLEKPGVVEALAKVTLARQRRWDPVLSFSKGDEDSVGQIIGRPKVKPPSLTYEQFIADRTKRWALFRAWFGAMGPNKDGRDAYLFMDRSGGSGTELDLEGLFEIAVGSDPERLVIREMIEVLVCVLLRGERFRVKKHAPTLSKWDLDLTQLRKAVSKADALAKRHRKPPIRKGFTLAKALEATRASLGSKRSIDLCNAVAWLNAAPTGYGHGYDAPEKSPLWTLLSEDDRRAFLEKAKEYVVQVPSLYPLRVTPKLRWSGPVECARWLMRWLATADMAWCLLNLNKITPALRIVYVLDGNGAEEVQDPLCRLFRAVPPSERRLWFEDLCISRGRKADIGWVGPVREIWTADLAENFVARLGEDDCPEISRFHMLGVLAVHKSPLATGALLAELRTRRSGRKGRAVQLILTFHVEEAFAALSRVAKIDKTTYGHIWKCLWNHGRIDSPRALNLFDSAVLKRLYLQACKTQPPQDDEPHRRGPHTVTTKDRHRGTRDALYRALLERNEEETWRWLERHASTAGFEWVTTSVRDHRNRWLDEQWIPPEPRTLGTLRSRKASVRLVKTDGDLLGLLLRELEVVKVQIESNPMFSKGTEPEITAVVAKFLDQQLKECIVNCEADAKPVGRRRTDIQAEAVVRRVGKKLKCVIETKMCSNVKVSSDVGKLRSEYLHDTQTGCGIYLVYRKPSCICQQCRQWTLTLQQLQAEASKTGNPVIILDWTLTSGPQSSKRKTEAGAK